MDSNKSNFDPPSIQSKTNTVKSPLTILEVVHAYEILSQNIKQVKLVYENPWAPIDLKCLA